MSDAANRPSPPGISARAAAEAAAHPQAATNERQSINERGPEDPRQGAAKGLRDVAVVLTDTRVVRVGQHTYHVPPGQVIRLLTIPVSQPFDDGTDTKLVDAGELKLGDTVKE